ncbi:MAG: hypothetical protein J7M21_04170 [Planctomycetes bacterium]|nr:hypothetical protein [Planctomycetota bacterium]
MLADRPCATAGVLADLPDGGAVPADVRPPEIRGDSDSPGGLSLLLMAVGGLGACGLGRSARKIHLAGLPAWYHAGGARQVGHVVALGPDLQPAAMTPPPTPQRRAGSSARRTKDLPRAFRSSQHTPSAWIPRGPPA